MIRLDGEATDTFRSLLAERVDRGAMVAVDDQDRFLTDERGKFLGEAVAVVRPATTEQTAAVVRLCAAHGVAVVPQGGNTGLCGGSVPSVSQPRPSVLLSTARMNRIRQIDSIGATVTAEAGVTVQALQEAAAGAGLLFGPDWGARGSAQIGGAISTNAGGLNVIRWGTMRRQVLGLEVVMADGRIWDGLRPLYKDASGIDLKQIFIGAEGTLGVVTAAVLALQPMPTHHHSALVTLAGIEALPALFARVRRDGGELLSGFELIPDEGIRRAVDDVPTLQAPALKGAAWYALIRYSGDGSTLDRLTATLATAAHDELILDAVVAATPTQERNLWHLRDELPSGRRFDEAGRRHKFDIAIPIGAIPSFIVEAASTVDQVVSGAMTYIFGHVGDGNLHFSIYPGPHADRNAFDDAGPALVAGVDALTWRYGGSISAEHGIGQEMRERVAGQKPAIEFELLAGIKGLFDPTGIMNPGKVLPPDWSNA